MEIGKSGQSKTPGLMTDIEKIETILRIFDILIWFGIGYVFRIIIVFAKNKHNGS